MYDLEFLTSPVSAADPCGPDLFLSGDADYTQYLAFSESILPASFFRFERSAVDLDHEIKSVKPFLSATRDLRLLVVLAKYQILDRRGEDFITTLEAIAKLLSEFWDEVHPRAEDGDFGLRINTLEALDDMAQAVLPLQHQPLFTSRRLGAVSYRNWLIAKGRIPAREDEQAFDAAALDSAFSDADLAELVRMRDRSAALRDSLRSIETVAREKMNFQGSVKFERLTPLAEEIAALLEQAVVQRDPSAGRSGPAAGAAGEAGAGEPGGAGASAQPSGPIANRAAARLALRAIIRYYRNKEPSSPALLLLRQAEQIFGKTFFDSLQFLLPAEAAEAKLRIGGSVGFALNMERLGALAAELDQAEADAADGAEPAPEDGDWPGTGAPEAEAGDAPEPEPADAAAGGHSDEAPGAAEPHAPPKFVALSRAEALGLMEALQRYFAQNEPSSAVPLLLDRARSVGAMDFMALLGLMMPPRILRLPED